MQELEFIPVLNNLSNENADYSIFFEAGLWKYIEQQQKQMQIFGLISDSLRANGKKLVQKSFTSDELKRSIVPIVIAEINSIVARMRSEESRMGEDHEISDARRDGLQEYSMKVIDAVVEAYTKYYNDPSQDQAA